jgi:putative ABC transport system permease protein
VKGKYYFPVFQMAVPFMSFVMRAPFDPGRLSTTMRDAVRAVDPTQPVSQIQLMTQMVNNSLAPRRFVVTVLGVFAAMALAMALIGLYGVISYAVTQRTQELGVRMALGAQPAEIRRLVLGQGMKLAGLGAMVGLIASLAISRFLQNELFHVSAFDPLTFALMAAALIAAALLASYIPARRATRVDPIVALRYE